MWALIPIKALTGAKQRLSTVLNPQQRQHLAWSMASDVITNVLASNQLEGVLVISDDPKIEQLAINAGCAFLQESKPLTLKPSEINTATGLNSAVAQGSQWLHSRNVSAMVVIHSDLPRLKTADLNALIRDYDTQTLAPTIIIVPDQAQLGSNILICPLQAIRNGFRFQYGQNSLHYHQREAQRNTIGFRLMPIPNLQFDIDSPQDLQQLIDSHLLPHGSQTSRCLQQLVQAVPSPHKPNVLPTENAHG